MQVTALRSWETGCCSKNGWGKLTSHSLGEETRRQEVTSKATVQTGRPLLSHMCPSPSHISPSPASHIFPSSSSHTPPFSISFRVSPRPPLSHLFLLRLLLLSFLPLSHLSLLCLSHLSPVLPLSHLPILPLSHLSLRLSHLPPPLPSPTAYPSTERVRGKGISNRAF